VPFRYSDKPTSKLHFLVPASHPHIHLCRCLLSAAVLGYPTAILSGWNATGELDAAVTHLAKVRNVLRYLDDLPPSADNDLVLVVDGYDVILQLPPEVLIQRYFEVNAVANARLAKQFPPFAVGNKSAGAPSAADIRATPARQEDADTSDRFRLSWPRQTILFGPDKVCWPGDWRRPACWAAPPAANIPEGALGGGDDDLMHHHPQWLNSGTIMGPVRDMRHLYAATMDRIRETYRAETEFRESDQMYMSDVWGEQEYARKVLERKMRHQRGENLTAPVLGGPQDRFVPKPALGKRMEYHVGIEYESALFQTWTGNENFVGFLSFNTSDSFTSTVTRNMNNVPDFQPFDIELPRNVIRSITRLLQAASGEQGTNTDLGKRISQMPLHTNLVTRHVYTIFHCTGAKGFLDELWLRIWFYPLTRSLLHAAMKSARSGAAISEGDIDGRVWRPATTYPSPPPHLRGDDGNGLNSAGAWADFNANGIWVGWQSLCSEHEEVLFGGERL
jgi:hypothetical protein